MFSAQPGWEHATFLSLLDGLTAHHALWRPAPGKRCIWQYVRHMLQWQTFVMDRLQGKPAPETYEPWPELPEAKNDDDLARLWAADIQRVRAVRAELIAAAESLDPAEPHPHPDLAHLPHWIGCSMAWMLRSSASVSESTTRSSSRAVRIFCTAEVSWAGCSSPPGPDWPI